MDGFALLAALVAAAGAAHLWLRSSAWGLALNNDGALYLAAAESLAAGAGLADLEGDPLTGYAPFFPMLLAFLSLFGIEALSAGRIVNIAAFGLLILAAGLYLGRRLESRLLALGAAVVIMTSLVLSHWFSSFLSEPLFILFTLLALIALDGFLRRRRQGASGGAAFLALSVLCVGLAAITRWGRLDKVLGGIAAARAAGLAVKINAVALKGVNEREFDDMIAWCGGEGYDLTLIETMPLGDITGDRTDQYLPLSLVRARLRERWTLTDIDYATGGPARYVRVEETGGRLGFITPLTHNFCESCNRVRLTCTGTLYMCLGQEDAADLRAPLRASESDEPLLAAIDAAIDRKPKGHDFIIDRRHRRPALARHMSVTGG